MLRCQLDRAAGLALFLAAASGCATAHRQVPEEARAEPAAKVEVGIASYYGKDQQGQKTASGVSYDADAMTCAHRAAPFGTRLRVTDLVSGRSVVVTVNDRGPYVKGRIVDLSLAAARKLGIVERGVAKVRVERLPSDSG
jgi:rare lipoprotein A